MKQYLDVLKEIRENGHPKSDRTGTGTLATFGQQMRFNLDEGFPLVTTKKVHLKSIIYELLWFLKGETNIKYLNDNGVNIWNEWADENGHLGPIYGKQWRSWDTFTPTQYDKDLFIKSSIDQIQEVMSILKNDPFSRRIIVNAWNVGELKQMSLTPCHCMFQFFVREPTTQETAMFGSDRLRLSCMLYQRSCDFFLGVPFNIASYALLTMMIAQCSDMIADEFIWWGGDTHLYLNHLDQADQQLSREPRQLPKMTINRNVTDIFSFKYEDFNLNNYDPHPSIKAKISV